MKLLNYILFYGFLIPLSVLPMRFLHFLSDIVKFLLYNLIGYRKKVVMENLSRSFPEKSQKELKEIADKFYSHLADLFLEAVKMLTISKKNLMKRYKCTNPEIIIEYYKQKKSIILVSAHYNNWEYMVASLGMQFDFHAIGVGKRMSNKAFEELMHKKRTRYGTEVCYADNSRKVFEQYHNTKTCAYMLLSDQSPNDKNKCYWIDFLNQKTAFIYGCEYFAKKYDYPVFFYKVRKIKRGYYEFEIEEVATQPQETEYGFIVEKSANILENLIKEAPQYWLWSHRRWKLKYEQINNYE